MGLPSCTEYMEKSIKIDSVVRYGGGDFLGGNNMGFFAIGSYV
jgi:hypothetical protein